MYKGNGDLKYSIDSNWFRVETCFDQTTARYYAVLRVNTQDSAALDRENPPKDLDFKIWAQDMGTSPQKSDNISIIVKLVDINDHPPRFKDADTIIQSPGIEENVPIGTDILRINLIDEVNTVY